MIAGNESPMSIALLALLALLIALGLSALRADLNTGVVALAFAYLIGLYAARMTAAEISAFLPAQLILTIVGVSLLFGMASHNGTLDRLAQFAVAAAHGHPALLPLIFFALTFALSALGPGNIAATALIAPVGLAVATRAGVSPLLMTIMICTGANAGAFSPVALTGVINIGLMNKIGITDAVLAWNVFLAVAALQSLSALGAYILFGGYRVRVPANSERLTDWQSCQPLSQQHGLTLLAILALVIAVMVFRVSAVVGAFVLAGALGLLKIGDTEASLKDLPWGVVALVGGISVLIGLLEKTGGLDLATSAIAAFANPAVVNALLALITGLVSTYSSSSGVVLPVFVPLLPGLLHKLGAGNLVEMVIAVDVGSHMVDVSPLSTLGALCLAALPATVNKPLVFRQLMLWGGAMAVVGAGFALIFLDWL